MSERRKVHLRLALIVLLIANVLVFTYIVSAPNRSAAEVRIEDLQINPSRIKLLGTASRGPRASADKAACLEWGPFRAGELERAQAALATLKLAQPPVQRSVGEAGGVRNLAYFVREPDANTVARITDLQRGFPGTVVRAGPCPG